MPSDIVFDQVAGGSISLEAPRVIVSGTINLHRVEGATPPADGELGDIVITVEAGGILPGGATTRLWLCVPPEAGERTGVSWWREIQLGPTVTGG
jgi:hypothetical protein